MFIKTAHRREINSFSQSLMRQRRAFTLAEVLVALTISSMVLVAVLGIYNRAQRSAAAITETLNKVRLPAEVLQRIAEDIDGIVAPDKNTTINIESKVGSHGFNTAFLEIVNNIYDRGDNPRVFKKIVWKTSYDPATGKLILYRSYSGIDYEDKLLDKQKADWERELFVPICQGVTFFTIEVPSGKELLKRYKSQALPRSIVVTISFAEPVKGIGGGFDVPDRQKNVRTIAVDRTRKIKFTFVVEAPATAIDTQQDPNLTGTQEQSGNEPNNTNK